MPAGNVVDAQHMAENQTCAGFPLLQGCRESLGLPLLLRDRSRGGQRLEVGDKGRRPQGPKREVERLVWLLATSRSGKPDANPHTPQPLRGPPPRLRRRSTTASNSSARLARKAELVKTRLSGSKAAGRCVRGRRAGADSSGLSRERGRHGSPPKLRLEPGFQSQACGLPVV